MGQIRGEKVLLGHTFPIALDKWGPPLILAILGGQLPALQEGFSCWPEVAGAQGEGLREKDSDLARGTEPETQ